MCITEGELPWMLRCEQPPAGLGCPGTVPDMLFSSHSTGQCWYTGQGASNGLQHHFFNLISPLPCCTLKWKSIIFLRDFSQVQKWAEECCIAALLPTSLWEEKIVDICMQCSKLPFQWSNDVLKVEIRCEWGFSGLEKELLHWCAWKYGVLIKSPVRSAAAPALKC